MLTKKCNVCVWAVLFWLVSCTCGDASDVAAEHVRPLAGFDYLLSMVTSDTLPFDPDHVTGILDYVASARYESEPLYEGGLDQAATSYYGFDVHADMRRLIRYCYNPAIPSCAVMPSMIRLSSWRERGGDGAPDISLSTLWTRLDDFTDPIVIRGVYYMQNTPDVNTGAYYGYDSYRTVILMKYKGRNALISVLKQKDVSDVGKKGYILGDEKELDYFYSGEKGLNMMGLSWVKSYLYDSFSVSVYLEDGPGSDRLRCSTFKWLKAGWAGKNMIRKSHIHKGLIRFADVFRQVMEAKNFPAPDQLADICNLYTNLPATELKKKMEDHILSLQGKCTCLSGCPKPLKSESDMDRYIETMSPMEMSSTLIVDHIKHILTQDDASGKVAYRPASDDAAVF